MYLKTCVLSDPRRWVRWSNGLWTNGFWAFLKCMVWRCQKVEVGSLKLIYIILPHWVRKYHLHLLKNSVWWWVEMSSSAAPSRHLHGVGLERAVYGFHIFRLQCPTPLGFRNWLMLLKIITVRFKKLRWALKHLWLGLHIFNF